MSATRFGYKERLAASLGYRVEGLSIIGPRGGIKAWASNNGYPWITLNKHAKCSVHRLVAYQLWGDLIYDESKEVRHLDGNKLNFLPDNIALGTHVENLMDRPKAERLAHAIHASSFVKRHDRQPVRDFYASCRSYAKTMDEFGISSKGTLHFILNGRRNTLNPQKLTA